MMSDKVFWVISGIGVLTLLGVFYRMKAGFGPFNLRVVGLVLITIFAALLALTSEQGLNAGTTLLGAIVGYLLSRIDKGE